MNDLRERLSSLSLEERVLLERQLLSRPISNCSSARSENEDGPKPLSFGQESLWYFDQLVPNSPLYNMPQAFRLLGELDARALEAAFQAVVQRQDALRTQFVPRDGTALQVAQEKPFNLDLSDLSHLDADTRRAEAERLVNAEVRRPFRLAEDLLVRARLIRLQAHEHILVVVVHHIVADFASLQILYQELAEYYRQILASGSCQAPPLPRRFAEFAHRQRQVAESADLDMDYDYWTNCFRSGVPVLQLPTDHPRGGTRSFDGSRRMLRLPLELTERLKELSRGEGVTVYMLLLAAFQTLLFRYTGQMNPVVGSPIEQREAPGAEQVIGFFLNTLVLQGDLSGDPTFRELLQRTRSVVSGALAHQRVAVEKLLEKLHLSRDAGTNPLYQVVFQYLPSEWPQPSFEGVSTELMEVETGTAKFDLTFTILESKSGLLGELEYNRSLFEPATIARMLGHFRTMLESITTDPKQHVSRIPILTPEERQQLLVDWPRLAQSDYPRERRVQEVFEEQARRAPEAIAMVAGDKSVSYCQLNREANQLAHFLVSRGIKAGQPVGVCLERSVTLVTALLGILKAGAYYVPLDANYPGERLAYMVQDSGVQLILTTATTPLPALGAAQSVFLDECAECLQQQSTEDLPSPFRSDALAYLLYTSGSTGQPKGVAVPHRGIVRLVKNTNYASFGSEEVFLQFAPISFDASTFEIWGALLNGAKLMLYPPQFDSLEEFGRVLRESAVTTLWLTAGLFQQLVDQHIDALAGVKQLLAGGDVLSVPHVRKVLEQLPNCQLINGYGPTENTTFSCCYRFPRDWAGEAAPIGKPVSNTQAYILDEHLIPVPVGVAGELCLAGDGLAREYWRSPELTARKFVPNPFSSDPQARLYRTGDKARYRADGTIEFLGRFDDQVKINGFRLQLSEVEGALLSLPGIRQAVVITHADSSGHKSLAAYLVPTAGLSAQDARNLLSQKLPAYMIPAHITFVAELPLTPNGKVDRRALPIPKQTTSASAQIPSQESVTPVQAKILEVWKEVFGRPEIGLDDNFFDLGGHSLVATRVVSRLNQAFRSNLSLAALFRAPTVRALAEKLAELQGKGGLAPIVRRAR